jgi:hypothetical protein
MSSKPYLRAADDGTYELVVPSARGRTHILPYCFHTEEDAMTWLASLKGREVIRKLSGIPQPAFSAGASEMRQGG